MRRHATRLALIGAIAVLVSATVAEAQQRRREPARERPPSREEIQLFRSFPAGERLAVVSVNGTPAASADRPIFTFTAGFRMQGFGGCNPVTADFRHGPREIRFGPLSFVERRCGPAIDRQERAIFLAIQGATNWRPFGRRGMTFTGRRGTVTFAPAF